MLDYRAAFILWVPVNLPGLPFWEKCLKDVERHNGVYRGRAKFTQPVREFVAPGIAEGTNSAAEQDHG